MENQVDQFNSYRERMNARLLEGDNKLIKRISAVLRCDDCVRYHLQALHREGARKEEVMETLSIATLVGGTIVIPHLRRAYEFWEALESVG